MKIINLITFALFILGESIQAQGAYSINADGALMMGNLRQYYPKGIGVSTQYEYKLGDKLTAVGRLGFIYIPNNFGLDILIYMVPIQAGVKYNLTETFYAQGMVGIHKINALSSFGSGSGTQGGVGIGLGAHLGRFDITPRIDILGGGWSYAGLRIGYRVARN